jgi:hypothetical protein
MNQFDGLGNVDFEMKEKNNQTKISYKYFLATRSWRPLKDEETTNFD